MSNPGTYKLSEKETKKINKELQKRDETRTNI